MRIYVLTRGRENRQVTLNNLSLPILKLTTLIAHPDDGRHNLPAGLVDVVRHPRKCKVLGDIRQWVVDQATDKHIVLLDDDFTFAVRRPESPTHFRKAEPSDVTALFRRIEVLLKKYAEVGVVMRQQSHLKPDVDLVEDTRINGILGFRLDKLRQHKVKFNRLPVMTDFDSCLQLLEAGERNAMITDFYYGQVGLQSNAPGGCSIYRTLELQAEGARGLQRLHPQFVTVVEKETRMSWGGAKRTDVRVAWRKAAAFGQGKTR